MSTKVTTQVFSLANLGHSIMGFLSQREQAIMSRACRVLKTYYHFRSTITTSGVGDFHAVVKYCSWKQEVALEGGNLEQIPLPPPTLAVKVFLARANTLQKMDLLKDTLGGGIYWTCIRETEFLTLFSEPNRFPALTELRCGRLELEKDPTPAPHSKRIRYFPSVLKEQDFAKVGLACPKLRKLFLYQFRNVGSLLSTMQLLEKVTFKSYHSLIPLDSHALAQLNSLKHLKSTKFEFDGQIPAFIEELPALTSFRQSNNADPAGFKRIVHRTTLEKLEIHGNALMGNEDLALLTQATHLTFLEIMNCSDIHRPQNESISPWWGLKDLARKPALTHFKCSHSRKVDEAMEYLPMWEHLREVTIERINCASGISWKGAYALSRCSKLERINIFRAEVSLDEMILPELAKSKTLLVLKIVDSSGCTTEGVLTFLKTVQNLQQLMLVRCKEVDGDRVSKVPTKVRITIE